MYNDSDILVPLVNTSGDIKGYGEKIAVHISGELHLAFSVMLFRKRNGKLEFLLQQRARSKYHSGNAWSNTCCSHPLPDEDIMTAARRRLQEELGIAQKVRLSRLNHIIYRSELDNKMIEHEYDVIIAGQVDKLAVNLNPDEVSKVKWWSQQQIEEHLHTAPSTFTVWFQQVYEQVIASIYTSGSNTIPLNT